MNKETERFIVTNLMAYEIFLLVAIISFARNVAIAKLWAGMGVVVMPLLLLMTIMKRNDQDAMSKILNVYFYVVFLVAILGTAVALWGLLGFS